MVVAAAGLPGGEGKRDKDDGPRIQFLCELYSCLHDDPGTPVSAIDVSAFWSLSVSPARLAWVFDGRDA